MWSKKHASIPSSSGSSNDSSVIFKTSWRHTQSPIGPHIHIVYIHIIYVYCNCFIWCIHMYSYTFQIIPHWPLTFMTGHQPLHYTLKRWSKCKRSCPWVSIKCCDMSMSWANTLLQLFVLDHARACFFCFLAFAALAVLPESQGFVTSLHEHRSVQQSPTCIGSGKHVISNSKEALTCLWTIMKERTGGDGSLYVCIMSKAIWDNLTNWIHVYTNTTALWINACYKEKRCSRNTRPEQWPTEDILKECVKSV